ncbi:MAG: hypothetical protein IH897_02010 [Planctomycetes bacterium]|nr:hypothetical protein [Planctomycetota bacterium]
MKVLFFFMAMVALGLAAMYYGGGFSGFDATQQGKDARKAIGPGMSWKQVFDVAREPRNYQTIQRTVNRVGGVDMEFFKPGPANRFVLDTFKKRLADNDLPHGFIVTYYYSNQEAFIVRFDGTGTVEYVEDAITMADLLQTRD